MEAQEILALIATHGVLEEKLCSCDPRNPDFYYDIEDHTEQEWEQLANNPNCYCENCFDGRTKLAQTLLTIKLGLMK